MDVLMHPEFGKKVVVRPINATPEKREEFQMWSYAAVFAPLSFKKEPCTLKQKF